MKKTKKSRNTDTPILNAHLASGVVYVDKGAYIGIASDGVHVQVGNVDDPASANDYLSSHPLPSQW